MNTMDGTNRRSRVGNPLLHTSGSSVIADDARGDYASNHCFGFSWRVLTPVMTE